MSDWINIKDELPEMNKIVCVWQKSFGGEHYFAKRVGNSKNDWEWFAQSFETFEPINYTQDEIDYWCELPAPPKDA